MTDLQLLYNYKYCGSGFQSTALYVGMTLLIVYSAVPYFCILVVYGDQIIIISTIKWC